MSGAAAHTVVILSIITELLFSLFLIIGWWVRPSALILALYTICVISSFSDFSVAWPELGAVVVEFLKGLAIVGGLFHVAGSGSGWFGCDFLVHKKKA
jgi:putative oxidoreductase